jgi:antitoxin (DNA-binding transcriptional repressor) of toxin-antitoxin stability system
MESIEEVRRAVKAGEAVVVCVYEGWIVAEIAAQLPQERKAAAFTAEIKDGRIVRLEQGPPEKTVLALLAAKP